MNRRGYRISEVAALAIFLLLSLFACQAAPGQLNSNTVTISLNAALAESISVSATPSSVNFSLVASGVANGSTQVAITTSWVLSSSRASVTLVGSFASASAALAGSTPEVDIPTSAVYGLMPTGTPTTFTAFTSNTPVGVAGAGLTLFTQNLSSTTRNSNRTDNLSLQINLSSIPQLPSATYTGSLLLQAQAL